jgi:NuA3 HAT complex component NTO1
VYLEGFLGIQAKLAHRAYTSVAPFSADLAQVLGAGLEINASSIEELQAQLVRSATDVNPEQRDQRTLARRIAKAVQLPLEDALRKEGELNGRPYAQEIKEMDEMAFSRRASLADSIDVPMPDVTETPQLSNGIKNSTSGRQDRKLGIEATELNGSEVALLDGSKSPEHRNGINLDVRMQDADEDTADDPASSESIAQLNGELSAEAAQIITHSPPASMNGIKHELQESSTSTTKPSERHAPPTPPMSLPGNHQADMTHGGIPWYVEQFDPEGTTIYEERWTGPEILREMSEELSEMDEAELEGLGGAELGGLEDAGDKVGLFTPSSPQKKPVKKGGRQKRGHDWGHRSFRNRR